MLAGKEDEVYSITYAMSWSSFTAPCPQLMQISRALVQLMGFVPVFSIRWSGQSCLLRQQRGFSLLFLTMPMGLNSLLCLCDCKPVPCDWGSLSCMGSSLHPHLPARESPWLQAAPSAQAWTAGKPSANLCQILKRDYDTTIPPSNGHNVKTEFITNGWMQCQSQAGLIIRVRKRQDFPVVSFELTQVIQAKHRHQNQTQHGPQIGCMLLLLPQHFPSAPSVSQVLDFKCDENFLRILESSL